MSSNDTHDNSQSNSPATVAPQSQKSGQGCANCESTDDWGHSSWCPRCGWYPALNTCVEVDPVEDEVEQEQPLEWYEIIPLWGWGVGAGEVALIVLSIFARITTDTVSGERGHWALIQLFIGFCALMAGQAWAYMYAVMKSSDFGPADIFFQPLAIWGPSNRILPKSVPRLAMALWGATAAFLAVAVIGGINYNAMFEDWGFEEQAQANMVHEIVRQAREADGEESLEDAMNDFVGDEEKEEVIVETENKDCLIIGYIGESPEKFTGLALATLVKGKLQYVGTVFNGIPKEDRAILADRMATLGRDRSFVKAKVAANWLQPKLMCRINCQGMTKRNKLKNPAFVSRLADAK
jgi:hypothetical protein